MSAVTILAAAGISRKKLARRLTRAGYAVAPRDDGLLVDPGAVTITVAEIAGLPPGTSEVAEHLIGLAPRAALGCAFDGPAGEGPSWTTVVEIARAVAADVPLAVLDDHAGITYLVNAARGLITPAEYEQIRGRPATNEILRRLLGS